MFIKQKESYSSQTSPLMAEVSKASANKTNRIKRGLYKDGNTYWNADCVGAFNILRLYFQDKNIDIRLNPMFIQNPYILKVAV